MVLYEVYSQKHRIRYLAHPCSSATLFQIFCLLLTFLAPLFTSYFTSGFYYKELTYTEQPNVVFQGGFDIMIDSLSSLIFSSSDDRLNNFLITSYSPSTLGRSVPDDVDGDGIVDQYTITLNIILPQDISDATINLWLLFQYALNQYPLVSMETLGIISLKVPSSLLTNSTATVYGQLCFQQRQPITSYANDSSIAGPIIDYGTFINVPSFDNILAKYRARNYFTTFDQQYVQWTSSASTTRLLTIKVVVDTGPQLIRYVPSFWKELRWTWIQYVTALIPFLYLANKVKEFVFSNKLVRTVVNKSP